MALNIHGLWHPEITLPLLPLDVEKYDILLAHHRDTVEKLEALRDELAAVKDKSANTSTAVDTLNTEVQILMEPKFTNTFLTLCTLNNVGVGAKVPWNGQRKPEQLPNKYYSLSDDSMTIIVKKRAMYQIIVRLLNTSPGNYSLLLIYGTETPQISYSFNNTITEIIDLEPKTKLSVQTGPSGCIGNTGFSRFTIIMLDDLHPPL